MSDIEHHEKRRIGLLLVSAAAFAAWQATELSVLRPQFSAGPAGLVAPVAIILWIITLVALIRRPAEARLRAQLEDELTRHNRLAAFNTGYWAAMVCVAVGLMVAGRTDIPAVDIVRAILVVGVAAPLVRFALLEAGLGVRS